jgi:demethylmenaquinone methyltransferase / 2-methoxy-6-polyprenyl-1,4-benzoquinol methylase
VQVWTASKIVGRRTLLCMASESTSPAWSDAELAGQANPHQHADKPTKVRGMFAAIADSYDLNNRVHSLWQDVRWRNFAVKMAKVQPGEHVLDVACGTGDLTQAFATRSQAAKVVGVDFTPAMLAHAGEKRQKLAQEPASKITYAEGDAQQLQYPDASFDVVSIAFGIRNVQDPARALREFHRVLKPAGRLIVLEFDQPKNPAVRWFNDFYCGSVMPRTATWISGDKSGAYKYLPKSVSTFTPRAEFQKNLMAANFSNVQSWALSLGICVCYRGYKA